MRTDWNQRAQEDARFYIAFGRRKQDDAEFAATASEVLGRNITPELARLPPHIPMRARRFLEIGCGIGRLMAPLSQFCGEIHGVDIADEMIRMGRERLADIAHAHLHWTRDSDLAAFADDSFDLVYSFAVMQHLPHEAPFWRYLAESARVLKEGGVLLQQFNSLAEDRDAPDTWAGIVVPVDRVMAACADLGLQVLALEGAGTQYTWLIATRRQGRALDHSPARARIGGVSVRQIDFHCEDRVAQRYQVNLRLPDAAQRGRHNLEVAVGDVVILSCEIVNGPPDGTGEGVQYLPEAVSTRRPSGLKTALQTTPVWPTRRNAWTSWDLLLGQPCQDLCKHLIMNHLEARGAEPLFRHSLSSDVR